MGKYPAKAISTGRARPIYCQPPLWERYSAPVRARDHSSVRRHRNQLIASTWQPRASLKASRVPWQQLAVSELNHTKFITARCP